jgi:hypothetical protein
VPLPDRGAALPDFLKSVILKLLEKDKDRAIGSSPCFRTRA